MSEEQAFKEKLRAFGELLGMSKKDVNPFKFMAQASELMAIAQDDNATIPDGAFDIFPQEHRRAILGSFVAVLLHAAAQK